MPYAMLTADIEDARIIHVVEVQVLDKFSEGRRTVKVTFGHLAGKTFTVYPTQTIYDKRLDAVRAAREMKSVEVAKLRARIAELTKAMKRTARQTIE